jgi:hypothetical protein
MKYHEEPEKESSEQDEIRKMADLKRDNLRLDLISAFDKYFCVSEDKHQDGNTGQNDSGGIFRLLTTSSCEKKQNDGQNKGTENKQVMKRAPHLKCHIL